MTVELDRTSRRVIAVLVEKELTTPNQYPMSVNGLTNGCNQKNNRDPVMQLQEFEVDGVLRSLYVTEWATNSSEAGSRVLKWKHRARERLGVEGAELAVMTELMLRGAQQPGELRSRANRLHPLASAEGLQEVLGSLSAKGLVRQLAKRPGERAQRWDHLLYPADEAPEETAAPDAPPAVTAVATPPPAATPPSPAAPDVERRLDELVDRVSELEARLERLEGRRESDTGA